MEIKYKIETIRILNPKMDLTYQLPCVKDGVLRLHRIDISIPSPYDICNSIDFGSFYIDERDNSCGFILNLPITDKDTCGGIYHEFQIKDYLNSKFLKLINSDYRYANNENFTGSKTLYIEDFINFLKSENREDKINSIIE